jgi:ABC-type branched-subunit amino acid transport system substrate-binding protein
MGIATMKNLTRWGRSSGHLIPVMLIVLILTGATVTWAAEDQVDLGLMIGFTGDMGPWAPAISNAAIVAVEEINADGGIMGKKVKLWSADNESTVEGGIRGAKKLVAVNKVSAIIGPESDPIMALLDYAKDTKTPIISTSAGTMALDKAGGTGNYIYRTNASDSFLGIVTAKLIYDGLGIKECAVITENLEGTMSAAETMIKNYEKLGGKIVSKAVLAPGQATYHSELKKVFGKKPAMTFLATGEVTGVNVIKQWYQKGYGGEWWVSTDLQNPEFLQSAGMEVTKGVRSQVSSQKEGDPGWIRFAARYEKRFGEKAEPGAYQSNTYDAVIIAALAMEAAKDTSGEAVDKHLIAVSSPPGKKVFSFKEGVTALRNGEEINYEGASGPVDFNQYGNVTMPVSRILRVTDKGEWITEKVLDSSQFRAD